MNLAITNRELYSVWTGNAFPCNPGAATWPVQTRIGFLLDGCDVWWPVTESTDQNALAASVATRVMPASLEWFSAFPDLSALEAALAKVSRYGDVPGVYETQAPLIRAILSSMRGNTQEARELMASSLAMHRGKPFAATIAVVAGRLRLDVA